jgi:hypothetical protein
VLPRETLVDPQGSGQAGALFIYPQKGKNFMVGVVIFVFILIFIGIPIAIFAGAAGVVKKKREKEEREKEMLELMRKQNKSS